MKYTINIKDEEISEFNFQQIDFDFKIIKELLERAEGTDDQGSESCTWQSAEYCNYLVRSRDAVERLEKLISKIEIDT